MGWLGFTPKTYIFSSFFLPYIQQIKQTINKTHLNGESVGCVKNTPTQITSRIIPIETLWLNKTNKQTLDVRSCFFFGSGDRTRVQKDIFSSAETPALFCLLYVYIHLHTTWLFFKVPSTKAKMSLSTNTTTHNSHTQFQSSSLTSLSNSPQPFSPVCHSQSQFHACHFHL